MSLTDLLDLAGCLLLVLAVCVEVLTVLGIVAALAAGGLLLLLLSYIVGRIAARKGVES